MRFDTTPQEFTAAVLHNKGATVVPLAKAHACANCRRKITGQELAVVWLEQSRPICADCVIIYLKKGGLLAQVEKLSPSFGNGTKALLLMMENSQLGRLAIITHCNDYLMVPQTALWNQQPKVVLDKALLSVFALLIKSVVYCVNDFQGDLIRLLASRVLRDLVQKQPSLSMQIEQLVMEGERDIQLGLLKVFPGLGWTRSEKLKFLTNIRESDDDALRTAIANALHSLGIQHLAEVKEAIKYQSCTDLLMHSYKPEQIKLLHSFIFRFIPGDSGTSKCSTLALEIAKATYENQDILRFYQALPKAMQQLVSMLLWRRVPAESEEIKSKLGLQTTCVRKLRSWSQEYYIELTDEYQGLLWLVDLSDSRVGVLIFSWIAERFKKILAKPEGAVLTGSETPPQIPAANHLAYNPDFVALLPNLYQKFLQKTITLKNNGVPTTVGYRNMVAYGGGYKEFYPQHKPLQFLRSELLFRMFGQTQISSKAEITSPLVAKALLDGLFKSSSEYDDEISYSTQYATLNIVPTLLTHLEWFYSRTNQSFEKGYLSSIHHLMATLPKNRWVTADQALDYLFLNDKELGSAHVTEMVQAVIENQWGSKNYVRVSQATLSHYWEQPLIKTFILLLASIGAVEVLCGEPVNPGVRAYNKPYLCRADGVLAFRLSALGEWYFQGGDESCFKKLERGQIVLDKNRLLLQLQGNDIALKAVLEQTTRVVGNNFYSVDSASFLKDCRTEEAVIQKISAFKALLPIDLPQVWKDFFETTLARLNPLKPVKTGYTILEVNDAPELRSILLSNRKLRELTTLAEGGLLLISQKNIRSFKKILADLGFFVDGF